MTADRFRFPTTGEERVIQQWWTFITMSLLIKPVHHCKHAELPDPSDVRMPGVNRIRDGLLELLEPLQPTDERDLGSMRWWVERLLEAATHLSMLIICDGQAEAELFWPDPKTAGWPKYANEQPLDKDDYFPYVFPAIRRPALPFGSDFDDMELEPRQQGLLPKPKRDWIQVPMELAYPASITGRSVGNRLGEGLTLEAARVLHGDGDE